MKKMRIVLVITLAMTLFLVANASAAAFYEVDLFNVMVKDTGIVEVYFYPAAAETGFEGKAKALIYPDSLGAKSQLATLLTAMSLSSTTKMYLDFPPAATLPQPILRVLLFKN